MDIEPMLFWRRLPRISCIVRSAVCYALRSFPVPFDSRDEYVYIVWTQYTLLCLAVPAYRSQEIVFARGASAETSFVIFEAADQDVPNSG